MARRDWKAFRQKVDDEGCCRYCGSTGGIQAAHLIARSHIAPGIGEDPLNCVPLCQGCHTLFDRADVQTGRTLDLIHVLTKQEQAFCVANVGIIRAVKRLGGGAEEDSAPRSPRRSTQTPF